MKRSVPLSLLMLAVLVGAVLKYPQIASSSSSRQLTAVRAVPGTLNLTPAFATTYVVDRTDDTNGATACTDDPDDCSLRGALISANRNLAADPVIIILQPGTTYEIGLNDGSQENGALTGDLDIASSLHSVTIVGGGSTGPNATIIDGAGLNTNFHDRVFHVTGSGVTATFQDLVIQNGQAVDDGTAGVSLNPRNQTTHRAGGGILNNGGSVTLNNVIIQSCQALGRADSLDNPAGVLEARGGGLASLGATGTVVVMNSTLSGNEARGGNGGRNVNNNVASNAKGGSIYFEGGTLTINGSRIDSSAANGGNGGNLDQNGDENGGFGGLAQGGGVWVGGGTVSINNTTFDSTVAKGGNSGAGGNSAEPAGAADGGGLYSLGNVTISNSTFHLAGVTGGNGGNAFGESCFGAHNAGDGGAARGGAVFADGGSLIVDTSTFAGNFAIGGNGGNGGQTDGACGSHGSGGLAYGGAITNNAGSVNIKHATISLSNAQAGNTGVNQGGANKPPRLVAEGAGGGVRVGPAGVTFENTIIADNTAANGLGDTTGAPTPGPNVDGAVTSNGHNLLGVATDATGFSGAGDQTGADPMLAALADNGGPTQTMALSPGSPAVDAGTAAGAAFDQRGLARTADEPGTPNAATSDATDIGAYEIQVACTLSCPGDVSVSNDTDQCGAVVNFTTPSPSGCGTVTCDHPSGSFFPVGETTVNCTSSVGPTCSFKVTVNDAQNPSISAPPNASYQCASEVPSASPSQATASDNCGTPTVTVSESTNGGAGSTASPLIITRTYTATDGVGRTASASQTITVIDNMPPVIACPANITVDAAAGTCSATVNFTVTASDNCSVPTVVSSRASGSVFPLGTTTVVATATDAAGNSQSCSFTVTVRDTQAPTISCPANITVDAAAGTCSATVNFTVTATDNCSVPTVVSSRASGSVFPLGTTIVVSTATDAAGNSQSCSFTVTVRDTQAPTISCPANITVNAGSGSGAVVTFTVTASDNCSAAAVTSSPASGSVFPVGTTTVVSTARDAAGNSTNCSFTVTVNGGSCAGPMIQTNGQMITLWPPDHKYERIRVRDFVTSVTDDCDPGVNLRSVRISQVTSDEPNDSCGEHHRNDDIVVGPHCRSVRLRAERQGGGNGRVYTITFKVTDASGRVATATGKVTVPRSHNGRPAIDDGPQYTVVSNCP